MSNAVVIKRGMDRGSVGTSNVIGCNISGGIIILNYANVTSRRYDAKSGMDRRGL